MERIFILDKSSAVVFSGLHPEAPETWYTEDTLALGVISKNEAAALLLATINAETIWLDWLYVKEEYRENGIGSRLINLLIEHTLGCSEDSYLHTACSDDMKEFLEHMGFEFPETADYATYTAPLSDVQKLPPAKESDKIKRLYKLSTAELNRIHDLFAEALKPGSQIQIPLGIELPVDPAAYLKESAVYMDDRIEAMLFLNQVGSGINVSYAYTASVNEGGKLLQLFANAKESIAERFWPEISLSATALNEQSEELIKKLLPEAKKTNIWKGRQALI